MKNFKRIISYLIISVGLLIFVNGEALAFNGIPHFIYGKIFNSTGISPDRSDIDIYAYIPERPTEILSKSSAGCGYEVDSFLYGWLWCEAGNYITPWSISENVRIIIINSPLYESGVIDLALDSSGNQLVSDVYLAPGDNVGPIASNILIDGSSPITIPEGTYSVTLSGTISDVMSGNTLIQGAEYFVDTDPGYGFGEAMNPGDGVFDSPSEDVTANIDTSSWAEGSIHKVHVRGQDLTGNWGTSDQVSIIVRGRSDDTIELWIDSLARTPAGFDLKANRIYVGLESLIFSNVYYNQLTSKRIIYGKLHTPLALPVVSQIPIFKEAPAGSTDIIVKNDKVITLDEGNYGDIKVGRRGKILFTGGIYNIRSINAMRNSELLFAAPAEIRITNRLHTFNGVYIGPSKESGIGASDIVFYVAGVDGNKKLESYPIAVQIDEMNKVYANFYAPNGTLWLRNKTKATGAFIGKDVKVDPHVDITLDSFFDISGDTDTVIFAEKSVRLGYFAIIHSGNIIVNNKRK